MKIFKHHGVGVVMPANMACCGIPALASGDTQSLVKLAKINLLEDIFITVVDTANKPVHPSAKRRGKEISVGTKSAMEKELASEMLRKTSETRENK